MELQDIEKQKLFMNGQEVKLKPPTTAGLKDFLIISRELGKAPKSDDTASFMEFMTNDAIDAIVRLVEMVLKDTFTETWETNETEIKRWGMTNTMVILPKIIKMCTPQQATHEKIKLDRLKDAINKGQTAKPEEKA